jgi:hypothetical protein
MFAFDPNVSGQPPQPGQLATEQEQRAEHNQRNPNPDQSFANVVHG